MVLFGYYFLDTDGSVKSDYKINASRFGNGSELGNDEFGISVTNLGDLDGDGVQDIVVGEHFDDDGGSNNGAVWILFLNETAADTNPPDIEITTPINNSNSSNVELDVNYTVSDLNLDSCWYSNDSFTVNVSLPGCSNITSIIWDESQHNVKIYSNDSSGNENSSSVTFTIDSTNPKVYLNSPANDTTINSLTV